MPKDVKEIRIRVNKKENRIDIINEDGAQASFQGVVIFAGDAQIGAVKGWNLGCYCDAAWATAQYYRDPNFEKYFKQEAAHIVQQIDPKELATAFNEPIDPEETLERWEKEDDENGETFH